MSQLGLPPEVLSQLRGLFVEEADQALKEAQEHCARWERGQPVPQRIKAVLHGLKGSSAAVELEALAALIHRSEELVLRTGESPDPERIGPVLRGLRNLVAQARNPEGITDASLAEVEALLRTPEEPGPSLPAPRRTGERVQLVEHTAVPTAALAESVRLAAQVQRALTELQQDPDQADALQRAVVGSEELEALLERMRLSPGAEALEGLEEETAQLAARLGKRVRLELEGQKLRLERRALQAARGALRHLEAEFVPFFAEWLAQASGWPVRVVASAEPLLADRVYLAAGGRDLLLGGDRVRVRPAASHWVPCGDVLLESLAQAQGARGVGVILSGMGGDGSAGLAALARSGGRTLCQAPASAVVPSMPQRALQQTPSALALTPPELARALRELA
ncbi:MAG: chemotaxis protein CheB [Myxococcota bacterium]|nr:chemotaxis protein CheB [Myxococcota bacterium]